MKMKTKKILSVLLAVIMIVAAVPMIEVSAKTNGNLTYEIENGEVTITDCKESASGKLTIPSKIDGYPVTSISSDAFEDCSSLTNVKIPDSVTRIGDQAFSSCTGLKSVTIPDSVTSIGWRAFYGCSSLTSITIPNSVTSIGDNAFYGTAYYNNSSNWKNGVLYIGNHLIEAKESIKGSYKIKSGTKCIANSAFYCCDELTSVTTPDSVTSIGDYAFSYCSSLTSIKIPDGVTKISDEAFFCCSSLKSITIPNSVTSIGARAFNGCTGLTSIKIPDSVISVDAAAFASCTGLKNITIPDSVISVDAVVFASCTSLKNITIPDSVTSIGDGAFSGCTGLKSITIPDSVTSIGSSAFYETGYYNNSSNWKNGVLYIGNHLIKAKDSIKGSYKIKSGTKCIADFAFYKCEGLTSITIPDSVTSIPHYTFAICTNLKSVTIPDSVTSIGVYAFASCSSLKNIELPNGVIKVSCGAFWNTGYYNEKSNWKNDVLYIGNHLIEADRDSIKGSYKIKSGTRCIADYAFNYCDKLTSVTIPDGATSIGSWAFDYCDNLKNINIPNSITNIGIFAFSNTAYYNDSSNWKNDVLYIGNHLIKADNSIKGSYKIKSGTKCIADNAFVGCTGLTSITIPDSVTSIGDFAFHNCSSLTSITIPGSVKYIGEEAFGYNDYGETISSFTIKGHKGSAANTYAKENGFKFVAHKNNYTSKVNTKATTSKNGKITYTCDCGYSYTKSISKIKSITLSSDTYTYNGKVKKPTVTVKDSKGNTLKNGTDYTVKYSSGRKNVGKYTVTVTFKGKYTGTKKLTFKIKPRSTSISKLTAGKKQFTATWYKRTEQTSGYQLEYSTSSSMKNASRKTYTTTSKTSRTVTGLKASTKYYVRIRTYKNVKIDGKTYKYYSAWSSVKSIKTK